jgi:hypothetical protein
MFTTLVGWEWTQTASGAPAPGRRIDASGAASTFDPVGADVRPPEELWDQLQLLSEHAPTLFPSA